ncbi:MAG TPA: hypothetical protein VJA47_00795 [archaeon]|nr:hypothetical protein [archaeon]
MAEQYVVVRVDPSDPENGGRVVQLPGRLGYPTGPLTKARAEELANVYKTKFGEPYARAVPVEFKLKSEVQTAPVF